ncbi:MAG: glycosyltransferase 87 family protein, partial [Candidatus Saccharimonadales bacterium]
VLNPPYSLFLFLPLGFLSAKAAVIAWSLLLAVFLTIAVRATAAMVDVAFERNYLLLGYFFVPALCCVEVGQTGLITLLGLALFLWLHQRWPLWAGAALTLCAVKPHLLLPFGFVLLAWVLIRRRWLVVGGAIAALAAESLVAMAFDARIWTQYREMILTEPFVAKPIATLGVALRFAVDRNALWVEFVPAAAGCAWALWYFWRHRKEWDWRTHGSVVTLVSMIVAPYSWVTDQVIVIPAILFALLGSKAPRKGSVTLLMAILSAKEIQMLITRTFLSKWDLVLAIFWLGWYLYATSRRSSESANERIHLPAATPAAN